MASILHRRKAIKDSARERAKVDGSYPMEYKRAHKLKPAPLAYVSPSQREAEVAAAASK